MLAELPEAVQRRAYKQHLLWRANAQHPSVQFKRIRDGVWSARVTDDYRALAREDGDRYVWFWIGSHREYDRLLARR